MLIVFRSEKKSATEDESAIRLSGKGTVVVALLRFGWAVSIFDNRPRNQIHPTSIANGSLIVSLFSFLIGRKK